MRKDYILEASGWMVQWSGKRVMLHGPLHPKLWS